MISVQNHLQQLSGNKFIWFITFLTLLSSCKVSQRVVNDPAKDVQIVKADNKPKKEKDSVEIIKENEKQLQMIKNPVHVAGSAYFFPSGWAMEPRMAVSDWMFSIL